MNRSSFIQNLIGMYGIGSLPMEMVSHYEKIYLLQCFVRGFQYYEGPKLIDKINKTGLLELVREPENKYDDKAIALHFNKQKIGFIPAESNEVLSVLMDSNLLELQAEITNVESQAATWENIHIAIYAIKEMESHQGKEKEPYHFLETPCYFTLKNNNESYTKIRLDPNMGYSHSEMFYEKMIDHSSNDNVYDLIHSTFENPEELEAAVEKSQFVFKKEHIPSDFSIKSFTRSLESGINNIDGYFGKEGYLKADVSRLTEIPDQIEKFVKTTDIAGNKIIEVVFKST